MAFLFNRTDWGRIRLTGADRVRFLHNQTTNHIAQLQPGEGCHTAFVSSTGRTIDLATAFVFESSLLVVVSPGMAQTLYEWMDRYIFFSDKVTLTDESEQTFMFTLVGEDALSIVQQLDTANKPEDSSLENLAPYAHQTIRSLQLTAPITIAATTDLALSGYTLWGDRTDAERVENLLIAAGAEPQSASAWEALRIQQGRPMAGAELTDEDNPLESGLWHTVSFEKGCYIGQETIARLNTYKGVKKRLWGLQLQRALPSETDLSEWAIAIDGHKVGRLTSLSASGDFALGYVRTKAGGEGLAVLIEHSAKTAELETAELETANLEIAAIQAQTVALPFIRHAYPTENDAR